jgi:hypothetical protein
MTKLTPNGGNIPEGIWVLNQAQSRKLVPTSHTLWIVKDDGKRLAWVSIETTEDEPVKITSWDGEYDGDPVMVNGSGFVSRLTSDGPGTIHNFGDIEDMGPYFEKCAVDPSGIRMVCHGQVTTPDGILNWDEVFEWTGPGPHLPLASA